MTDNSLTERKELHMPDQKNNSEVKLLRVLSLREIVIAMVRWDYFPLSNLNVKLDMSHGQELLIRLLKKYL